MDRLAEERVLFKVNVILQDVIIIVCDFFNGKGWHGVDGVGLDRGLDQGWESFAFGTTISGRINILAVEHRLRRGRV